MNYKDPETRRKLFNKENKIEIEKLMNSINSNKERIKSYGDDEYDKKRVLLMQNVHFYNLLTLYKQIKKPEIKEFKVKTEKFIENDYDDYAPSEINVECFQTDGQLQYNITNK